jgi:hypothetical protein
VDVSGRTSNGPAPISVSPAPMSELALDIQETKEEENLAERRYRHIQRMERSVALQMGAMFKRQRRVIMEKASSRKIKDKWDAETKISATDVFDKDIWDSQFVEDANTWITSAVIDGMIEISGMGSINNPANQNNPEVLSIIEQRSARMALVNDTTKSIIDSVFEKTAGKSHADFISVLEETITASTASRIATIARTEVSGSFNSGMMIAAKDAGFTRKSWVPLSDDGSRHNHASIENSIIDIDESFVIDGKSISYPGDINGVPDEIVNCRCTLRFS